MSNFKMFFYIKHSKRMNIMWSISLFALMSDFRFLLINNFIQFLCFFYHLGNILINEPKLKQSYIKSKVAVMIAVLAPLVLQSTDQLFSLRNDAICYGSRSFEGKSLVFNFSRLFGFCR